MLNRVLLKGRLTHDPYFDRLPASGLPFLRFYLGVDLARGSSSDVAETLLRGNLAQPPYFDHVPCDPALGTEAQGRPFLRLHLAVDRPPAHHDPEDGAGDQRPRQAADFLRVVAYDDAALFSYPYLQPGSEVLVEGNLRARKRKAGGGEETVVEVVAFDVTFLRKIAWEAGDAERERILRQRSGQALAERAAAAEVGTPAATSPLAAREPGGGYFRVVAYGDLALFSYPYLQRSSEVFVKGRLQRRVRQVGDDPSAAGQDRLGRKKQIAVVEVVAENIRFLRDVTWERGDAAREQILRLRSSGALGAGEQGREGEEETMREVMQ